ncbi:MAG: hypothetical protein QW279_05825 [Candidatus Jordarchaeaceae archaeon]
MSREAMLAGTTGGIIGTIMGVIGVVWSLVSIAFAVDYSNYSLISLFSQWLGVGVLGLPYPSSSFLVLVCSIVLGSFLIVSCTLLGVGFWGVYKAGGGAMGMVGLVFGVVGGTVGGLLIILGPLMVGIQVIVIFLTPLSTGFEGVFPVFLSSPNYVFLGIGVVILVVTFILLGLSSIVVRNMTENSAASTAAGILSIIGGCLLIFYTLVQGYAPSLAVLGGFLTLVGFILIFTAFILWTIVFFNLHKYI